MLSFLRKLFRPQLSRGHEPKGKEFEFLILERGDDIPLDRWYRLNHWQSPNLLIMKSEWSKDWKNYSNEEDVVGVAHEDRERKFLIIADQKDFSTYLERDPKNRHDPNAVKVMGKATVNGSMMIEQLGFLSRETAYELKDEEELACRPSSVYLPYQGSSFGLKLRVLVRSQAYKKRKNKLG